MITSLASITFFFFFDPWEQGFLLRILGRNQRGDHPENKLAKSG
jgi:hypothetical protein